jgi:hypothetical protein
MLTRWDVFQVMEHGGSIVKYHITLNPYSVTRKHSAASESTLTNFEREPGGSTTGPSPVDLDRHFSQRSFPATEACPKWPPS